MRIYIDSNTFPATPGLYADAAKTKPIPRMIPAVELQRGGFEVAFVGSNQPQDIASVSLVASIDGAGVQVVAERGEDVSDDSCDAWRFNFALNAESLVAEIAKRGSVRLRVGVIVEDDTERREWQFSTVVYPSASSEETDTEAVESSKNFAELAEQAAKRAQEAQADVAGNAQLAEQAKQTATQAANAAIGAADSAEVSERNAAESKEAAEQAKEDAEAAKTEAKKAASDAQATLGNVYTKSQIDGVSTGAEVVLKMNEIIAQLKDYEEVTGEKLPFEFWEAVMAEFQRWQKNPNEVKEWRSNSNGSTNPYNPISPKFVVDFNVTIADGVTSYPSFGVGIEWLFAPAAKNLFCTTYKSNTIKYIIAPTATTLQAACQETTDARCVYAPNAQDVYALFRNALSINAFVYAPKATKWGATFRNNFKFNRAIDMSSADTAGDTFYKTAMSPENIAATLDTLPLKTDGISRPIQFSRNDGTKLAPLMAESPYKESVDAAVARGWTVQFDNA
ncbi:MAG: hypothetical protein IKW49_08700 [Opitutales bacterium]|nr:hypothetical protein [Opitutales bacterium]